MYDKMLYIYGQEIYLLAEYQRLFYFIRNFISNNSHVGYRNVNY